MLFATVFMPPKAGTDVCIIPEWISWNLVQLSILDALIRSWQSKKESTTSLDKYKLEKKSWCGDILYPKGQTATLIQTHKSGTEGEIVTILHFWAKVTQIFGAHPENVLILDILLTASWAFLLRIHVLASSCSIRISPTSQTWDENTRNFVRMNVN